MKTFIDLLEQEVKMKELKKWNYWLVFESKGEVVHLCGFMEIPNENDIEQILKELKTDEEFKLPEEVLSTLSYEVVDKKQGLEIIKDF